MLSVFIGILDAYYGVSQRDTKAQKFVCGLVGCSKFILAGKLVFQSEENLQFPPPFNFYLLIFTISLFPKKEMMFQWHKGIKPCMRTSHTVSCWREVRRSCHCISPTSGIFFIKPQRTEDWGIKRLRHMTKDIPRALGNEDPNLLPLFSWAATQKCSDCTLDTLKSAVMDPFS